MSFNRQKYEYFFPSKVYRCACLGEVIDNCFDNGCHSFVDIYDEVSGYSFLNNDISKVFSIRCGELKKDAIFVCENHLAIVLFARKNYSCTDEPNLTNTTVTYTTTGNIDRKETYCTGCIRHYLRLTFHYFYHKNFDLKF